MSSNRPPSSNDQLPDERPRSTDEDTPTLPLPAGISNANQPTLPPNPPPTIDSVHKAASAPGSATFVGSTFGDYEILEEIARGGMGVIYKARQKSLDRTVALKMILSGQFASEDEIQRFTAESTAAAKLDHKNIVPIFDSGVHGENHYFSMKLIEGNDLGQEMKGLRNDLKSGVAVIEKTCRAIHHAHQRGILHRDLKPGNILIDVDGEPYVTDLGLARQVGSDSDLTRTGAVVGTPSYMPPEQASGSEDVTTAADVYSLGAILYELLAGRPPFSGDNVMDTLMKVIKDQPERPSMSLSTDRNLEMVAMQCLAKSPSERYPSAEALADDLKRWLNDEPVSVRTPSFAVVARNWLRQNFGHAIWILIVGLVAGLTAGLCLWFATVQQDMDQIRSVYSELPSVDAPTTLATWKTPDWAVLAFMVLFTCAITFIGFFTAALARTRNRSADLAAGITVGVIASAAAFFTCFGTLSVVAMNIGNKDIQLVSKASAVPDGEIAPGLQELLDEYPELESKSRAEQTQLMLRKIQSDHLYQANNGIILGTLSCLILFLTAGVVETLVAGPIIRSSKNFGMALGRYMFSSYPFGTATVIFGVHATGAVGLGHHGIIWNWLRILTFIVLGIGMLAEIRKWHWLVRLPIVCVIGVLLWCFFAFSFSMMPIVAQSTVEVNKRLRLASRNPDNMRLANRAVGSILTAGVKYYENGYYPQADARFIEALDYIHEIPLEKRTEDILKARRTAVMNRANTMRRMDRLEQASNLLFKSLEEHPDDGELRTRAVDFHMRLGLPDEAQQLASKGVADSKVDWDSLRHTVCLAFNQQSTEQLREKIKKLLERSSLDSDVKSQLRESALVVQKWHLFTPAEENDQESIEQQLSGLKSSQGLSKTDLSFNKVQETLDTQAVDLIRVIGNKQNVSCFALAVVVAKEKSLADLYLGSDDSASVWVNGELLQEASGIGREYKPREDHIPCELRQGENLILLRIDQIQGEWSFGLQIDAENGWQMPVEWKVLP